MRVVGLAGNGIFSRVISCPDEASGYVGSRSVGSDESVGGRTTVADREGVATKALLSNDAVGGKAWVEDEDHGLVVAGNDDSVGGRALISQESLIFLISIWKMLGDGGLPKVTVDSEMRWESDSNVELGRKAES